MWDNGCNLSCPLIIYLNLLFPVCNPNELRFVKLGHLIIFKTQVDVIIEFLEVKFIFGYKYKYCL